MEENNIKILAFAGSLRHNSYNKKLIKIAVEAAREKGAEVTLIDLKDYPMPIYDGDIEKEHGMPENAQKFKELMIDHQGFLIASPEYNSSYSGVLKNVIDWASRPQHGEKPLIAFNGKVAAIISTSTGGLGGVRGLLALRNMLGNIKVIVLPEQVSIPHAADSFDEQGKLKEEKKRKSIKNLTDHFIEILNKLHS
jgi:chromate reductase, NAD(P)H dehydrogenase (quinone)